MRISWLSFLFIVISLVLAGLSYTLYSHLQDANTKLDHYKDIEKLNARSKSFVMDFAYGKYKKYLTGDELARYEKGEKTAKKNNKVDRSEAAGLIENVKLKRLFTKEKKGGGESFAEVEIEYNPTDSEVKADHYIQNLVLKTDWKKAQGKWMVNHLNVSLLEDSRDDMLRKQAKEQMEKAKEKQQQGDKNE